MLDPVLKEDIYFIAVTVNKNTPLYLHLILDLMTSDELSCKYDIQDITLCE